MPQYTIGWNCWWSTNRKELDNSHKARSRVLDINMKDGSGFDLLKSFTDIDFNVVFVTAYSEFDLQAFNHRALDYLVKPVAKDELIRTIERIELIKRLKSGLSPLSKYIVDTRM